jgi:flavin-dependent dehydrogenase
MRYAMISGSLAAKAMVSGRPEAYDALWEERLGGILRTGFVNRWLYARLGERGYVQFTRRIDQARDPRAWLGWHYRPSWLKRALLPFAKLAIATNRRENQRVADGCDCTLCRCQHETSTGTVALEVAR